MTQQPSENTHNPLPGTYPRRDSVFGNVASFGLEMVGLGLFGLGIADLYTRQIFTLENIALLLSGTSAIGVCRAASSLASRLYQNQKTIPSDFKQQPMLGTKIEHLGDSND